MLLIGLDVLLILRIVEPNRWYGFRGRRTLQDPGIRYKVNAFAGVCFFVSGIVIIVSSMALYTRAHRYGLPYGLACTVVDLATTATSVILSFWFLGRIGKSTDL